MSIPFQISLIETETQIRIEWLELKSQRRLSPTLLEAYKFWRRWAQTIEDGQLPAVLAELEEIKKILRNGIIISNDGPKLSSEVVAWNTLLEDLDKE
jgi:hypothetical protein